ncbi:MAG: hypothetical protein M0036_12060, partial [Desulfobacteraceae bacterium]|nr:hypothetical protein [Desulfobacteraceae bacterium]
MSGCMNLDLSNLPDQTFTKDDIAKLFLNNNNLSFNKIYLSKNVIYDPGFDITKVNNFQNGCPNASDSK